MSSCVERRPNVVLATLMLALTAIVGAIILRIPQRAAAAAIEAAPHLVQTLSHSPTATALMLAIIALLDVVPLLGHMSAKPLQYAICWVYGYAAAAPMLAACMFASLTLQYLLGRYLLYDWVRRELAESKLFLAIDRAFSSPQKGLPIVVLCRLNPLLPEVLTSYAMSTA